MQVYVAVYDMNFNFLVAQAHARVNTWWSRETFPDCNVVQKAGQFCLPADEKKSFETIITAGERILLDKTGRNLPELYHCTRATEQNGYALVCFVVAHLKAFQNSINKALTPRLIKSHLPSSAKIKDWEMERFVLVQQSMLDEFLGAPSQGMNPRFGLWMNEERSDPDLSSSIKK